VVWIVTKPYVTAHFEMFKIIYLKVLYHSKSVMKSGSILKLHYIRSHYSRSTVYLHITVAVMLRALWK